MSKRTNTAVWQEKFSRWRVAVQKDGQRRYFYSSLPGRTGQREANRKADAWLEDGIGAKVGRVEDVYKLWIEGLKQTTSASNYEPIESRWRTWVLPIIGKKRVNALTDADLQAIINKAHAAGKSRKTLQSLAGDLRAFCKYCRKSKLSTYLPEDVQIPASARLKGKKVLQPDDLIKLFSIDTTLYRGKRVHDDYINAYRFAVLTGLRPGELLGLRWADIKGSTVNISRAINVKGVETRGKNENACRSFVLPDFVLPDFVLPDFVLPDFVLPDFVLPDFVLPDFVLPDVAKAVLEAQRAITGHCESVFCLETERRFYKRWKVYCAANDLQPVSLYELRHSFVSAIKTLPAGEVKALVGHSQDILAAGNAHGNAVAGLHQFVALYRHDEGGPQLLAVFFDDAAFDQLIEL